jgi:nitrite reductase/ring-hydroxylating ferredoxin subunit
MVALFGISLIYRTDHESPAAAVILALEGTGFVLMNIAGWMGGTLVHRNQIGVDPRYAFAGKWREEIFKPDRGKVRLGNLENLKRDQMMLTHIEGKRIVIARTEDGYVAFDDHCTHKGGSLAGGMMICGTVQCPWHGSQFDVRNGSVKAGPAGEKISTYEVQPINGVLYLLWN